MRGFNSVYNYLSFRALFFGSVAIYNLHSARKYGESYLPAIVASMMFISSSLFLVLPLQYGSVAFLFTTMFALVNYKKNYGINKERMRRHIGDSQGTGTLKFTDYFTGWKMLHHLNRKYGPAKASLINTVFMWVFSILLLAIFSYLWPDIFSSIRYMALIVTMTIIGFYWQNKKLLENLDSNDFHEVKKK